MKYGKLVKLFWVELCYVLIMFLLKLWNWISLKIKMQLYDFITLCFFGNEVHVMSEAITERSRAMAIATIAFVIRAEWVVGWYLEWELPDPSIDSSVYIIWELYGSLVFQDVNVTQQFVFWGHLRTLEHWVLSWYLEWASPGPPGCVCDPCVYDSSLCGPWVDFLKTKSFAFS